MFMAALIMFTACWALLIISLYGTTLVMEDIGRLASGARPMLPWWALLIVLWGFVAADIMVARILVDAILSISVI